MRQQDRVQLIHQRLIEATAKEPQLASYYQFQQRLLQLMQDTKAQVAAELDLADPKALEGLIQQGLPLLSFAQLPIEAKSFANLAAAIAQELVDYYPDLGGFPWPTDAAEWRSLAAERFDEMNAQSRGLVEASTRSLSQLAADLALKPYLEWAAERVLPHLNQARWKFPYCPACGGAPDLALLAEDTGARKLACSRCSSLWSYQRLGCPFCQTTEFAKISYYASEDEIFRLYTCDNCSRYLKTIDLRKAKQRLLIEVDRITTVDLDIRARELGYN